jgi:hypothetical protein
MAIRFKCSQCGKQYRVKDELAGKTAECQCGNKSVIPDLPAPRDFDIAAHFPSTGDFDYEQAKREAAVEEARNATEQLERRGLLNPWAIPGQAMFGRVFAVAKSPLLQIILAACVGAVIALSSVMKLEPPRKEWLIPAVLGGTVLGGGAGMILVLSDKVRQRKKERQNVPYLIDLFVGRGVVSLLAWSAAAFVGAILYVVIFLT